MAITLGAELRALVDGRNHASLATVNPDGGPQNSLIWITRDGDDLLFSTLRGRRKERNLRRDPRASVTVWDAADPERYAEIRGTVTITEDKGRALVDALAHKYTGADFPAEPEDRVRVVLRLTPTKITGNVR
ncbi:PPOX class probable F420-dependent enzyme [Saccharothrix coeruleofusca]|uniref:PPOX class F420-dependent oxidoreductase n=1 Tax=Saccharothrix coeruleofusca TaxID=33919 RepID=UPI001AEB1295|nr:PPOX class F420-dependent oxidoreductase [Saccharothrix coeruleofusca]MBP2340410.1 PPOX class probable F420-dependent enzyme [Saccharothrix coeruleofusca]